MLVGTVVNSTPINPTPVAQTVNAIPVAPVEPTPVAPASEPICACTEEKENLEDFTAQFKGMFDALTEKLPENSHQAKSSKNFFKKFSSYIGSKQFKDDVNEKAEKYKVPPKQIAKNFFLKVLGIIGDILGIVINTVCNIIDMAITVLSTLAKGCVTAVNRVANGIASAVTLNQTVVA
jgi:hypothetical protein